MSTDEGDPGFEAAVTGLTARGPGRMVPDLARITALTQLMGDPQLAYPSIHVTGTNGKGSIVRMIGSLFAAAGVSAGTFTSPHLQTVRERLSLAGRSISPTRFAELYAEVAPFADVIDERSQVAAGDDADRVTYFEMLTAMAYGWFADVPVDVGVFEVGMGGRWDATNLVRGDIAVIGEIDVDHAELGATPGEIALEKTGIIKPGATVISAEQQPDVMDVIERAVEDTGSRLLVAGEDIEVVDWSVAVGGQLVALRVGERVVEDILLPLHGAHQASNAALALGAFAAFTDASFTQMEDDVVRHGLDAVTVPGRLEIVQRDPTVVLDGAHNPHGARASAQALEGAFGFRELVLVVACLDDKDVEGILAEMRYVASHVVVTRVPGPRAASLDRMRDAAAAVWDGSGVAVEVAVDIDTALTLAESVARAGDGILVAGSLVTVGAARDRYLPLNDLDDEDEVVIEPDDEPDPLDEVEAKRLAALLDDDLALHEAVDDLRDPDEDWRDRDAPGRHHDPGDDHDPDYDADHDPDQDADHDPDGGMRDD